MICKSYGAVFVQHLEHMTFVIALHETFILMFPKMHLKTAFELDYHCLTQSQDLQERDPCLFSTLGNSSSDITCIFK